MKEELLDAALSLVGEGGLDALTVTRLAERMGWTKGAMYRYFPGMGPLVAALNARVLDRWSAAADAAIERAGLPADAPLERLSVLVDTWIGLACDEPDAFGLIAITLADPRTLVADPADAVHVPALVSLIGRVADLLGRAASAGQLTPGDPRVRALQLLFAVQGVVQLRKLARFDPVLFDPRPLGAATARDLLRAWGAVEVP